MPSETDLYFPVEDNRIEASLMPNAQLFPISSIWGHVAGAAANPPDVAFVNGKIRELLGG